MTRPEIDYGAVFRDFPGAVALLTPEFVIADANSMYLQVAGRTLDDLLGRNIVDAFPDNPADPDATGTRNLTESLQRVLDTEAQDCMPLQRYDVEVPGSPGVFEERVLEHDQHARLRFRWPRVTDRASWGGGNRDRPAAHWAAG